MVGKAVRGGVSILAALTVAVSGAAVSVANAAGSSDELCAMVEGGCGGSGQYGYGASRGDVAIVYKGPEYAVPGQDVTFVAELRPMLDEGETPGVSVDAVTHLAPEGFEYTGADVSSYEETSGVYPIKFLESSASVDPETGAVVVAAPNGGWTLPARASNGIVYVNIHYRVTKPITDEYVLSYINFTGRDVAASDEWVKSGAVYPGFVNPAIFDLGSS
jgi:hypothetical protein